MSDGLTGSVLKAVSRSFYLSIKALPPALREPIGLAYLLARTTDTIADTATVPVEMRRRQLTAFGESIQRGGDGAGLRALREEIVPADPGEQCLLARAEEILAALRAAPEADREEIREVLRTIVEGQELDLMRFGAATGTASLATAAELDQYTYAVAGCVGEFWTKICVRRVPGYAVLDSGSMQTLGRHFGMGLQLVNILRDLPADLRAGRSYLPAEEISPATLRERPFEARPVVEKWIARAEAHLADAQRYIESVRPWRLRLACLLPWAIGVRTLALLRAHPPLETAERVKVTRREVRAMLGQAMVHAIFRRGLDRWRESLSRPTS